MIFWMLVDRDRCGSPITGIFWSRFTSPAKVNAMDQRARAPLSTCDIMVLWTQLSPAKVYVKRDKSRSETEFTGSGSLWGSVAIGKTARKLGIFWPLEAHLIDSR